jgi:hypothetical protein
VPIKYQLRSIKANQAESSRPNQVLCDRGQRPGLGALRGADLTRHPTAAEPLRQVRPSAHRCRRWDGFSHPRCVAARRTAGAPALRRPCFAASSGSFRTSGRRRTRRWARARARSRLRSRLWLRSRNGFILNTRTNLAHQTTACHADLNDFNLHQSAGDISYLLISCRRRRVIRAASAINTWCNKGRVGLLILHTV